MKKPFFLVDAFTDTPFTGNSAGVVLPAEGIKESVMQSIATEINSSETAFIFKGDDVDFRLRFFTPGVEVDFCGHAFVASVHTLLEEGFIEAQGDFAKVVIGTNVGKHPTSLKKVEGKWLVEMEQIAPLFRGCNNPVDEIAAALRLEVGKIGRAMPLEFASTGLWHLMVPVVSEEALESVTPDFKELAKLNKLMGVHTTHLFTTSGEGYSCRSFCPAVAVDEDPVTGSASGAFGGYLLKHGRLQPGEELVISQGIPGGRGGKVRVVASGTKELPGTIRVGGFAVITASGDIYAG